MYVFIHTQMCEFMCVMHVEVPMEARGHRSLGIRVKSCCEPPNVSSVNQT